MNEKRRIFIVITQGEEGGAQRFVAQLAQEINPDRFQLHVVWGSGSGMSLASHLPTWATYATAHHLVRHVSPWHDHKAIGELRSLMRAFRPHIVLCISSKAGFVGSRAAHALRKEFPGLKVIYRIGGWTFNDPLPNWKRKIYLFLEKYSAQWKDVIVVNNTYDLQQAQTLGIIPRQKKILCIYNGIDPYIPVLDRESARTYLESRIPEGYRSLPVDWTVGTIANFYPAKDLTNLIRAAARVGGNVRFVVIGDGQQRAELEQLILKLGLRKRVFLVGRIKNAWRYLSAFDVFVLPSIKEGFPWALLEAMAARIPVVATHVGAVPEMIEDHASGIIAPPGSAEHLASGVVELLGNDRLRRDFAIAAHQQVMTKFSLHEMVAEYEQLFS